MDYKFEISRPESKDFRCEIAINGEQTFQQLHDKIIEILGFDGSQMASFFALDKLGNRGKEIALMEMFTGDSEDENKEEENTLVMDVTNIREVVNASCIELEYVYDFFANKCLKVEYAGEYIGDSADILPLCIYCQGEMPQQADYDVSEDWSIDMNDGDGSYDDSFAEEFGGMYGKRSVNDDSYGFDNDDDDFQDDDYSGRHENLDDYIDKL